MVVLETKKKMSKHLLLVTNKKIFAPFLSFFSLLRRRYIYKNMRFWDTVVVFSVGRCVFFFVFLLFVYLGLKIFFLNQRSVKLCARIWNNNRDRHCPHCNQKYQFRWARKQKIGPWMQFLLYNFIISRKKKNPLPKKKSG